MVENTHSTHGVQVADPQERIRVIHDGMRCFTLSLAGLLPLLGLPFAITAMVRAHAVQRALGGNWAPVGPYLKAARILAPLSLLVTFGFLAIVFGVIPAVFRDMNSCGSGVG